MSYRIKFEVIDEDMDSLAISDSTFIEPENITSAEDIFYRLTRNLKIYEDVKQRKLDEEIKEIKEEEIYG